MTSEDPVDRETADEAVEGGATAMEPDDGGRNARPIVAGAVGLLAGVVGGIVGTSIAPDNLFLTVLLVVVVVLTVTFGVLHVLAR